MLPAGDTEHSRRFPRVTAVVVVWAALAAACTVGDNADPRITVSPGETVRVQGPQVFQASVLNTFDEVTWTLDGPGTLSGTIGYWVTWRPPATPAAGLETATLTATVAGAGISDTVALEVVPLPTSPSP